MNAARRPRDGVDAAMSVVQLDLLVWRRGLDPAAEACEHALRDLMQVPVAAVQRAAMWRFRVPEAGPEARTEQRRALQQAAWRAGRYINLNRDACGWFESPRPYPEHGPGRGCAVDVWVRSGDGRDRGALEYFRLQGVSELQDLQRGVLWRLLLKESDPQAARRRAEDVATTRSRRHGLLANPHSESVEVLHVVCGPQSRGQS